MIRAATTAIAALTLALAGCGGGGGSSETGDDGSTEKGLIDFPDVVSLTAADVEQVIAGAVAEAQARGVAGTIAVSDRVGNVLAVYEMTGADRNLRAFALASADGSGLDGLNVPAVGANSAAAIGAIAKAITGAYLSSSGNAFTTRTASQIVQENFNPGELRQPGGPLFGVQFSSLTCSDLVERNGMRAAPNDRLGPRRTPLGLSADPGGLPLYKQGPTGEFVTVGGVGVIVDGVYGVDREPLDRESEAQKIDELVALAGTRGFLPPLEITAPRITVEGKALRYTDLGLDNDLALLRSAAAVPGAGIGGLPGQLISVIGYYDASGGALPGTAYGDIASGYIPASALDEENPFQNSPSAFVLARQNKNLDNVMRRELTGASDQPGGSAANALTRAEVIQIIDEGLGVALAGRGQIRRPIESPIHVTVSVVDTLGNLLGIARTPDGPIFGTDVALQKARSALFFSSGPQSGGAFDAATLLDNVLELDTEVELGPTGENLFSDGLIPDPDGGPGQKIVLPPLADYRAATEAFLSPAQAVLSGGFAYSARGLGNLARPFYPDGINDNGPGPLSRPINGPVTSENWSPFSTGLQFDLVGADVLLHVLAVLGVLQTDPPVGDGCTSVPGQPIPGSMGMTNAFGPLANGLQIFAGGVPIYRGDTLIGAVGVSGDGIDQDDMVAALGVARAAAALGSDIANPPAAVRSDQLVPQGARLRYVSCPFQPFRGSDAQNVCNAL